MTDGCIDLVRKQPCVKKLFVVWKLSTTSPIHTPIDRGLVPEAHLIHLDA